MSARLVIEPHGERGDVAPDGTWLLVEPLAGDKLEDNLNPVGRLYYSGSTFLCVPNALSRPTAATPLTSRRPRAGSRR